MRERLVRAVCNHHLLLLVAALFAYVGFGTGFTWDIGSAITRSRNYFGFQADAFLQGHLHLGVPKPTLDMSFYEGHIYLYWGPFNTAFPLLWKLVFQSDLNTLVRSVGYCLLGAALFGRILNVVRKQYLPTAPRWLEGLFLLTLLFGSPIAYIATAGSLFHNESISLSFAVQMLCVLCWIHCLAGGHLRWFIFFGISSAVAIATRMTNLFALPALYLMLVLPRNRRLPCVAIAACIPAIAVLGLMWFNNARFGNPFETGMRYATGFAEHRALLYEKDAVLSFRWVPLNSFIYFLNLPPFRNGAVYISPVEALSVPASLVDLFPHNHRLRLDAHSIFFMTPLLLAAVAGFRKSALPQLRIAAAGILTSALCVIVFLLCYAWAARRFTVDFVPLLLIYTYVTTASIVTKRPEREHAVRSILMILCAASVLAHFPLMVGAGSSYVGIVLNMKDFARLPHAAWPAVAATVMLAAFVVELALLRRSNFSPIPLHED